MELQIYCSGDGDIIHLKIEVLFLFFIILFVDVCDQENCMYIAILHLYFRLVCFYVAIALLLQQIKFHNLMIVLWYCEE